MVLTTSQISAIADILSSDEIIDQSSPPYSDESKVWSFQKNLHPQLVVRPKTLASVQRTITYLCNSTVDFAVRSGGVGSSSSEEVVISMTAFDELKFDPENETVIIGAGQTWGEVDRKMEEVTDGYVGR
jgi:FAD/FMN-containing dehydrogenase